MTRSHACSCSLKRSGAIRIPTDLLTRLKDNNLAPSTVQVGQAQRMESRIIPITDRTSDLDREKLKRMKAKSSLPPKSDPHCVIRDSNPTNTRKIPRPSQDTTKIDQEIKKAINKWKDDVVWDLSGVSVLRELLKQWVYLGVTASNIGQFLETVLYRRDDHLDNRLTLMVDTHRTYACIAIDILSYYQVRDDHGNPLWKFTIAQLGDRYARAKQSQDTLPASRKTYLQSSCPLEPTSTESRKSNKTNGSWYQIPAPKPLRPFQKPSFLDDPETCCAPGTRFKGMPASKLHKCGFDVSEARPKRSIAERRPSVRDTGSLPRAISAEIIGPSACGGSSSKERTNYWLQKQRQKQKVSVNLVVLHIVAKLVLLLCGKWPVSLFLAVWFIFIGM